jgi:hypothetical protein
MKRTTVTLPRELVDDLMEVTRAKNKTQAVIGAVQESIKRKKVETLKRLAGFRRWQRKGQRLNHDS